VYAELSHAMAAAEGRNFVRLLIEERDLLANDPYNDEIIRAIEKECRTLGLEVMLSFVREQYETQTWLEGVSGLILVGGGLITDELILELKASGRPLVLVDNYTRHGDVLSVHSDHYGAGYLAAEYLIRQGHKKIGFIRGPAKYKPLIDRYAGYCAALAAYGLPLVPEYAPPNIDRPFLKGYEEMKALMALDDRPTAVFAVSDRAAFGAVRALNDLGLRPGVDIALIGCDNVRRDQEYVPDLPTVHIPRAEVGQMAARFLLEAIKGNALTGKVVIPGRLIVP
jgi:LacI family transcriptional regulator